MDSIVTEADWAKIATFLPDWKTVAEKLGVDSEAIDTLDKPYSNYESRKKQRSEVVGKRVVNDGPEATYRALYSVLKKMGEPQAAKNVKELARLNDCYTVEQYQLVDLLMRHASNGNGTTSGIHRIAPSLFLYTGAYNDSIFQPLLPSRL
ncbi:hypothetical protein EMCRGX_G006767 [Ephydatia muelleri]